jgi:Asp-tRNA(Asn)/Glu-tRNA(Gln) amidotransferase A subunit family amidase
MEIDFRRTSLAELAGSVRRREVSARELAAIALARIDALNPLVNAFVAVDGERALEQAAAVDQIVASGGDPGPLAGIPIGVKDLEDAAGYRTTHGSPMWADDPVAEHDSVLVARLRASGCVVVGKTNTPEFGWTAKTENALFGTTKNPWNLEHTPGGSSGGTAAALAAGMVPLATGSDGGGSIRIPAACCGLSGVKTSMGRVPSGGPEPPQWPGLSAKGPMARRIQDVVLALDVVVAPEPTDLRSLPRPEASWLAALDDPHPPAKVLWAPTLGYATVDAEVLTVCQRALSVLESLGTEVVEIDTVFEKDPLGSWLTLTGVYLLRTLEGRPGRPGSDEVDPGLTYLIDRAREVTGLQMAEALDACHRVNLALVEIFSDARILLTPTCAGLAPPIALGGLGLVNGEQTPNWVAFTYPFNMSGSPAASVCAGFSRSGLPVGLQVVGPAHGDLVVLRTAAALEAALGFEQLAPVG